ncbi:9762_t:CDS:1, partial [Racocetra persica]
KKKALGMEDYRRDKDINQQKDTIISEETLQSGKSDVDIDSIVNGFAALSINYVEHDDKLSHSE